MSVTSEAIATTAAIATTPVERPVAVLPRATSRARAPYAVRRSPEQYLLPAADLGAAAAASLVTMLAAHAYHPVVVALAPLVWLLALAVSGAYRTTLGSPATRPRAVLNAGAVLALAGWAAVAAVPEAVVTTPGPLARVTVLWTLLAASTTVVFRTAVVRLARPATPTVVLAGTAGEVGALLRELRRPGSRLEPVALCVTGERDAEGLDERDLEESGLSLWRSTEHLAEIAVTHRADAVLTGPATDSAELRRLGHTLHEAGVRQLAATGLRDVEAGRLGATVAGTTRVLEVRPAKLVGLSRAVKGVTDRVVATALLLALTPVLLTIAVMVRRDSPGAAIYRQTRVGRGGRPFTVYKFRTMRTDADQVRHDLATANESDAQGVLFKIRRDPRITRIGGRLRKYSLDELPQLLNVVRGEMSLIGPRPALPTEVAAYDEVLSRRLVVKPGMTGLWQVSGRSDLSWEETVRLDLSYVDNWSWRSDLSIALKTVGAVLTHRGAY